MYLSNTWQIPGIFYEKENVTMFILDIIFYFHVMPLVSALEEPQSHVMITLEGKKNIN